MPNRQDDLVSDVEDRNDTQGCSFRKRLSGRRVRFITKREKRVLLTPTTINMLIDGKLCCEDIQFFCLKSFAYRATLQAVYLKEDDRDDIEDREDNLDFETLKF